MNLKKLAKLLHCACCLKSVGKRPAFLTLNRAAEWAYPSGGNVVTGESGRAIAVVCDACLEARWKLGPLAEESLPVKEAIEFRGDIEADGAVLYHPVAALKVLPVMRTYQLQGDNPRRPDRILCLRCGLTSFSLDDILHKFCGHCGRYHEG